MTESRPSERTILTLLFVGVLMGALDIAIVAPALPALRTAFAVDERAIAWVLTAYVLCNLIGTTVMGALSDARGRRAIYIIAVSIFAAGSLVVALSPSYPVLIAGRALQGFGAGGIFPVASAVIGDVIPIERRGRSLGLIGAVFGVAFLIGPLLGGALLLIGWPFLFLVNLPVAAYVIYRSRTLLPAAPAAVRRRIDTPGLVLLSIALFCLAFGLNRIGDAQQAWPFLAVALVLAPLFWAHERRTREPMIRPTLFRSRQVGIASSLALGAGLSEAAIVFVPALLVAAFHVTESRAAFMLMPIVLAMAVAAPVSGRALDRFGSRAVVMVGCASIGAGMLMVALLPRSLPNFYVAGVIIGIGLAALLGSSLRYVMLNEAPAEQRGAAQGLLTLFTSIGQLLGAAAVGAMVVARGGGAEGYDLAFESLGAFMLLLAVLAFAMKSRPAELAALSVRAQQP